MYRIENDIILWKVTHTRIVDSRVNLKKKKKKSNNKYTNWLPYFADISGICLIWRRQQLFVISFFPDDYAFFGSVFHVRRSSAVTKFNRYLNWTQRKTIVKFLIYEFIKVAYTLIRRFQKKWIRNEISFCLRVSRQHSRKCVDKRQLLLFSFLGIIDRKNRQWKTFPLAINFVDNKMAICVKKMPTRWASMSVWVCDCRNIDCLCGTLLYYNSFAFVDWSFGSLLCAYTVIKNV